MARVYVIYNRRSCVTGRALFDTLSSMAPMEWRIRRSNRTAPRHTPDVVIRWGNSLIDVPEGCLDINPREAVERAADKLQMANTLMSAEGVAFPDVRWMRDAGMPAGNVPERLYIRSQHDHVRVGNNIHTSDKYATAPIDKSREFRVHIFDGRTLGVYEKFPHDPSVEMYKNDNCDFRRLDMANTEISNPLRGLRPMARAAVDALGLVYGGADVILSTSGQFYVNEVNSAPALNEPNLERWSTAFIDYINEHVYQENNEDGS